MNIKSNKGVTMVDISISIMIIFLFSSLITGLLYNYAISTKAVNRRAEATYQAVNIIEAIKTINYDDMVEVLSEYETIEGITKDGTIYIMGINELNSNFENISIEDMLDGYSAEIQFEKYSDRDGNEEKEDVIIITTVTVKYKVANQEEDIELNTLLVKEKL